MVSFSEFKAAQRKELPIIPESCAGQTYIVTGANTGIGFEAAKHFVRLDATRVILAVRSPPKGDVAKAKIEEATGRTGVAEVWPLDLASYDSIRAFAQRVSELDRIDAVVENAGVALTEWTLAEGSETTITVNVLGTMLLAMLLLPALRKIAMRWKFLPRLTIVTSGRAFAAKFVEGQVEDVFAALNVENPKNMHDRYASRFFRPDKFPITCLTMPPSTNYSGLYYSYSVSKLLEVYAVRALASRLPVADSGVIINLLNPGFCQSELTRNVGWILWLRIELFRLWLARTAEAGSRTILHAAVAGEESHGKFCSDCEIKEYVYIFSALESACWFY